MFAPISPVSPTRRAARRVVLSGGVLLALGLAGGCRTPLTGEIDRDKVSPFGSGRESVPLPTQIDATAVDTRDDVVAIHHFWKPEPWRRVEDRAVGFTVPVYFVSAESQKGVFVSGKILIWLYELTPKPDGEFERECVHVWELDRAAALGFRVRKLSVMGYHYGFALTWPPNLDLAGKRIEVVFGYERADGQIVTGPARRFRVPGGRTAPIVDRDADSTAAAPPALPPPPKRRTLKLSPAQEQALQAELQRLGRDRAARAQRDAAAPASPAAEDPAGAASAPPPNPEAER